MRFSKVALAAAVSGVNAQRPSDTPICDYYVKALLKDNTAQNQAALLTKLVNTVVIGNYTQPNHNAVPGILKAGTMDGKQVNLAPYFTGALASTNTGGKTGESVNFLDGGGAEPLMKDMPANDKTSKQYFLLTHLYEFFGTLLGCSMQGMSGFDAYGGDASMYEVHKFMDLDKSQVDYFVSQVGLAAQSFGVDKDDITTVATALNSVFNVKCGPATTIVKSQGAQLQSICVASDCTQAKNATCDKYETPVMPSAVSGSMMASGTASTMASGTGTAAASGTGTMAASGTSAAAGSSTHSTVPSAAAVANGYSFAAAAAGLAAFLL